jgi:hypothetical protein
MDILFWISFISLVFMITIELINLITNKKTIVRICCFIVVIFQAIILTYLILIHR